MKLRMAGVGKLAMVAVALSMTAVGAGCAIHAQSPIKEIAYDFSDADFYDRAYAPSPQYAEGYVEYQEDLAPLRRSATRGRHASSVSSTSSISSVMGVVVTDAPGPLPVELLAARAAADDADVPLRTSEADSAQSVERHVSGEALRLGGLPAAALPIAR